MIQINEIVSDILVARAVKCESWYSFFVAFGTWADSRAKKFPRNYIYIRWKEKETETHDDGKWHFCLVLFYIKLAVLHIECHTNFKLHVKLCKPTNNCSRFYPWLNFRSFLDQIKSDFRQFILSIFSAAEDEIAPKMDVLLNLLKKIRYTYWILNHFITIIYYICQKSISPSSSWRPSTDADGE